MKINRVIDGYMFKIKFWGDAITPVYKFKMYETERRWFPKLLWVENIQRSYILSVDESCRWVIEQYKRDLERWGGDKVDK